MARLNKNERDGDAWYFSAIWTIVLQTSFDFPNLN